MKKVVAAASIVLLAVVAGHGVIDRWGTDSPRFLKAARGPDGQQATGTNRYNLAPVESRLGVELAVLDAAPAVLRTPVDLGARDQDEGLGSGGSILGVEGTVAVVGEPSVSPSLLNGRLRIGVWSGTTQTSTFVEVAGGEFRAEFAREQDGQLRLLGTEETFPGDVESLTISLGAPELDLLGPVLLMENGGRFRGWMSHCLELGTTGARVWVQRAQATLLHVVDKASGVGLGDVQVLALSRPQESLAHPAGARGVSLTNDVDSPVTLVPPSRFLQEDLLDVVVGARGYGWAPLMLSLREGGERRVELQRGADLEVAVLGDVPPKSFLRLYRDGMRGRAAAEKAVGDPQECAWDSLAPGVYHVRLERGRLGSAKLFGAIRVVLEPGVRASAILDLDSSPAGALAKASGHLVVPPGWSLESLAASVQFVGRTEARPRKHFLREADLEPVAGLEGTYAFRVPPMPIGRYEFQLAGLSWRTTYDLPAEGRDDLQLKIPEPVPIVVRYVHAGTRRPMAVPRATWSAVRATNSSGGLGTSAGAPVDVGKFQLQVTAGPVELTSFREVPADGSGHFNGVGAHRIDVQGPAEFTLELRLQPTVTLRLREGTSSVPWPAHMGPRIEAIKGASRGYSSSSTTDREGRIVLLDPGGYRVTVPELPGYESHPPVTFDVSEGQEAEVVIQLTAN